jgi:hypothetical protein
MDTVRIARRRFGRGGNGLQQLAPRLGVFPTVAHRALADAQTTAMVFERLMEPVGGWEMCLCDALREQGGPMGLLPLNPRESLLPLELEEALEQRKPVRMEYLDARESRTERVVEPLHVRRRSGELMLVAHCHLRNSRRTFKLERIVQLTRIDATAEAPAACVLLATPEVTRPLEEASCAAAELAGSALPVAAMTQPVLFDPAPAAPVAAPLSPIVHEAGPLTPDALPGLAPASSCPEAQTPEEFSTRTP